MASPGTSWHYGTEPSFPNSEATPIGFRILGLSLRDTWGFEFYYNIEINKWLHLTSDLQLVKNEFILWY